MTAPRPNVDLAFTLRCKQDDIDRLKAERLELVTALYDLTRASMRGEIDPKHNPFLTPVVKRALIAIATATGKSTFGSDWMDAIDQPRPT